TPQVARTHERVLVEEQSGHTRNAEPVEDADVEADADRGEQHHRDQVQDARAEERAVDTEARGPRVQSLLAVDLDVEERVEEVEARHPRADRTPERPGLP